MPELPEVEIIKLGLQKRITGLTIQKIQVLSAKSFNGNHNEAEGQKILNIWRRAKILGMDLSPSLRDHEVAKQSSTDEEDRHVVESDSTPRDDNGVTLLIHLKMSGQLVYIPNDNRLTINDERFIGGHPTTDMVGQMPNSHTRVIFSFSDGSNLYFNDLRRFGWVKLVRSSELGVQSGEKILGKLGPEPFDKEFTWQILKQNLLKHPNFAIKVAIMDQSVVAGVGNIYSNEACFNAKLDPRTKVKELTDKQFQALYQGIIKALTAGIKHGGSTRADFVDAEGKKGYFLDYAFVYGRDGKSCKVCGTKIKKIPLGGRGTYFCEHCQG